MIFLLDKAAFHALPIWKRRLLRELTYDRLRLGSPGHYRDKVTGQEFLAFSDPRFSKSHVSYLAIAMKLIDSLPTTLNARSKDESGNDVGPDYPEMSRRAKQYLRRQQGITIADDDDPRDHDQILRDAGLSATIVRMVHKIPARLEVINEDTMKPKKIP